MNAAFLDTLYSHALSFFADAQNLTRRVPRFFADAQNDTSEETKTEVESHES